MGEAQSFIQQRPKYSYNWAAGVVDAWWKDHARVTDFLGKIQWFSRGHLARVLVDRPREWRWLKSWVVYVDKSWILVEKGLNSPKQVFSDSLAVFLKRTQNDMFRVLTGFVEESTIKELNERGLRPEAEGGGAKASIHSWIQGELFHDS